jgi:uncharacterized RDD family membrane protein YckC
MRCPKCQYISFDGGDRCRNCGYDFSLTVEPPPAELSMRADADEAGPLADFTLREGAAAESAGAPGGSPPRPATVELPLFTPTAPPDAPLVTPAAVPRTPLSVRRNAPGLPKPKPSPTPRSVRRGHDASHRGAAGETPRLALEAAEAAARPERTPIPPSDPADGDAAVAGLAAPLGARLGAALIDLLIVGGIDAAVLYFTLRICELTFRDVLALPLVPLVAFLLFLDGGYFTTFVAAAGQTIGKMATGLRVVPGDPVAPATERVSLGTAVVRAAAYLVSALPAGLGFLPALFSEDGRALHDRLADTRVVKA